MLFTGTTTAHYSPCIWVPSAREYPGTGYPGKRCCTLKTPGMTSYHPIDDVPCALLRTKILQEIHLQNLCLAIALISR